MSDLVFKQELLSLLWDEITPLIQAHWQEIAHFKDIELNPDHSQYDKLEADGVLRMFTARTTDGELVGYANYMVTPNIHYKQSLIAAQDVLFIQKGYRGNGMKFIDWCDHQLFDEGVQVVYQHTKKEHDFGSMLERINYHHVDQIYARRAP